MGRFSRVYSDFSCPISLIYPIPPNVLLAGSGKWEGRNGKWDPESGVRHQTIE